MNKTCVLPLEAEYGVKSDGSKVHTCRISVGCRKQTLVVATRDEVSHPDSCSYLLLLCPKRHANMKTPNIIHDITVPLLWKHKQTGLHVDPAELCDTTRKLKVSLHTL